jgi:Fe-S-cluster containining protein
MDPNSALFADLDLTSEQQKALGFLAELTERMVVLACAEHKTRAGALRLIKEVYRITDQMVAGCLKSGTKPSCTIGCYRCCYLRVKASPLEVWCIFDFLRSHLTPRQLSALRGRLAASAESAQGMDGYQRVCAGIICPLLVSRKCSVYPVRPVACRVYHSLERSDCETPFAHKDRSVKIRNDIAGLGVGISSGLGRGLRAVGLRAGPLELVAALAMVMHAPGLVDSWLAGEPAFLGAEITNAQNIESLW